MQKDTILDELPQAPAHEPNKRTQRIFMGIELALWGLCAFIWFLNKTSALPFHVPLVLAFALLGLFYLLCPIWIFGSVGWRRHIGSQLVGIAMMGSVLPILFVLERSPIAAEQIQNAFNLSILASVFTLVFYFARKGSPRGRRFFLNVLARTAPMALVASYLSELVVIHSLPK